MNVLHIGKFYHPVPGGIETQLRMLVLGLKALGVEQRIVVANTNRRTETDVIDGVEVVRIGSLGSLFSTPLAFNWRHYIRNGDIDVIHLHIPNPIATFSMGIFSVARRLVVSYHADIVRQKILKPVYNPVLRRVLKQADRIVIASNDVQSYDPVIHPFKDKCVSIGYGIDSDRFVPTKMTEKVVEQIRGKQNVPIILFVGRQVYYKGLDVLIRAMTNINARLLIVGTGPKEREMKKLARKLSVSDKIDFIGYVPDEGIAAYYHACNVFCLPSTSKSEAFGIVQLEAMACGKPVVCTDIGTATSLVNQDGLTGIVVPPNDPAKLAHALSTILGDPAMSERFGSTAQERVQSQFDYRFIAREYYELYKKIL